MDLPYDKALRKLNEIQAINFNLVNPRKEWFLSTRRELEKQVRELFIQKGGKPIRKNPFYMTVGECNSMGTWYEEPAIVKISISEFDLNAVSFTYGDMFPIFIPELNDGKEYRENVYRYDEIIRIIDKYGYPENIEYNLREGIHPTGAPLYHFLKYVEAHIWDDKVVNRYRNEWLTQNSIV